jgi:hypothetical protein
MGDETHVFTCIIMVALRIIGEIMLRIFCVLQHYILRTSLVTNVSYTITF